MYKHKQIIQSKKNNQKIQKNLPKQNLRTLNQNKQQTQTKKRKKRKRNKKKKSKSLQSN